jgi:membrane protein DedA with SNARE-associated domain
MPISFTKRLRCDFGTSQNKRAHTLVQDASLQDNVNVVLEILGCLFGTLLFFYFGWGIGQFVLMNYDSLLYRYPEDTEEEDAIRRARNRISCYFGVACCLIIALVIFPAFRHFIGNIILRNEATE